MIHNPGGGDPSPSADARDCTTLQQTAHNTELEVCYAWHPWYHLLVSVDRVVHRRGGDVAYVRREVDGRSRLLELPVWMLDRSACALLRLSSHASVDLEHLRAVKELLLNVARATETIERHLSPSFKGDAHVKISSPGPDELRAR